MGIFVKFSFQENYRFAYPQVCLPGLRPRHTPGAEFSLARICIENPCLLHARATGIVTQIIIFINILVVVYFALFLFIEKHTPFYPPEHTFTLVLFIKQFKCSSRFVKSIQIFKCFKELDTAFLTKLDLLSILRKVSSEYFYTFYESRRTSQLFQ